MGNEAFTSVQLASILGQHGVKLVPDIAVGGGEAGGLAAVMVAKMLQKDQSPAKKVVTGMNGAVKPIV